MKHNFGRSWRAEAEANMLLTKYGMLLFSTSGKRALTHGLTKPGKVHCKNGQKGIYSLAVIIVYTSITVFFKFDL